MAKNGKVVSRQPTKKKHEEQQEPLPLRQIVYAIIIFGVMYFNYSAVFPGVRLEPVDKGQRQPAVPPPGQPTGEPVLHKAGPLADGPKDQAGPTMPQPASEAPSTSPPVAGVPPFKAASKQKSTLAAPVGSEAKKPSTEGKVAAPVTPLVTPTPRNRSDDIRAGATQGGSVGSWSIHPTDRTMDGQ